MRLLASFALVVFPLLAGFLSVPQAAPAGQARLGMNLAGPADWNTEHPFVDVFRLSREWISQRKGQPWGKGPPVETDAEGWIRRLEPDCWAETPILTHGRAPSGDYICLYEGDGEVDINPVSAVVSRAPGRLVARLDGAKGGVFVVLRKTDPQRPVRNLRVLMPGFDEKSPPRFAPRFLERWRGFDTLRFMDWQETNGSKQRDWSDRPLLTDSTWTQRGVPVEVMAELCNQLNANAWFCMPHLASDDYVRQFAQLAGRLLKPGLKIYVEYSNEVWNGMFAQNRYAQEQGRALGLGDKSRPWEGGGLYYARRSVEIFGLWEKALGGRDRLRRVLAWQAAAGEFWTDNILLAQNETAKHCDVLAIAPYLSFICSPSSKPPADEVAKWSVEQVLDYTRTNELPQSVAWIRTQKKVADKYGLELACYEAGQHLVGAGGGENNETLTQLFIAANRHARMGEIYTAYLDAWREAGGGLCCLFSSVASPSKWGSWGLLEGADQPEAESPKFQAVAEWRRRNPR